jgi:GT2 family glycosyltransferase
METVLHMKCDVSIIIATCNRTEQLLQCLRSIKQNIYKNYEIIVVDQSDKYSLGKNILIRSDNKIRYYRQTYKNKSRALNFGVKKSNGNFLVFTDDDCIVDRNWIKNILVTYKQHPTAAGVFGYTRPYNQQSHKNQFCPAIYYSRNTHMSVYYQPLQYGSIGIGNNMSIPKSIFKTIKGFREWLAPGSLINAGEDTDVIVQLLKTGYPLVSNPKAVVYHNRWLDEYQYQINEGVCTRAVCAFCFFYITQGDVALLKLLLQRVWEQLSTLVRFQYDAIHKSGIRGFGYLRHSLIYISWQVLCIWIGVTCGFSRAVTGLDN